MAFQDKKYCHIQLFNNILLKNARTLENIPGDISALAKE